MKNILLFFCFFAAMSLSAQDNKYTGHLGGTSGFSTAQSNAKNSVVKKVWSFSPEIGIYPFAHWGAGINFLIEGVSQGNYITTSYGCGIYVRRYFPVTDNFSMILGLNGSYKTTKAVQKFPQGNIEETENGIGAFFDLGMSYQLSPRWSLIGRIGTLGYNKTTNPDNPDYGEKVFGINLNALGNPFLAGALYKF